MYNIDVCLIIIAGMVDNAMVIIVNGWIKVASVYID